VFIAIITIYDCYYYSVYVKLIIQVQEAFGVGVGVQKEKYNKNKSINQSI